MDDLSDGVVLGFYGGKWWIGEKVNGIFRIEFVGLCLGGDVELLIRN